MSQQPLDNQYDVVVHLCGEQRIPNLIGVQQFVTQKHIFVKTQQITDHGLYPFLDDAQADDIIVEAHDPRDVYHKLMQVFDTESNASIAFNLTGGTKLMYAGAMAACNQINGDPFYYNHQQEQFLSLADFSTCDVTAQIDNVETFIQLHNNDLLIHKAGRWQDSLSRQDADRTRLTKLLWQHRASLARLYSELKQYNETPQPFIIERGKFCFQLSQKKNGLFSAMIHVDGQVFELDGFDNLANYASGQWLEEYCYLKLQPLLEEGLLRDLRIGLEVNFKSSKSKTSRKGMDLKSQFEAEQGERYQEFDGCFTEGKDLYLIECKAGKLTSEQVNKFQALVESYGGREGKGILVTAFPPENEATLRKIEESRNITHVLADRLALYVRQQLQS